MEFLDGKKAAQLVSEYIEREMLECRRMTERELTGSGIAPAAREAFNRKPYSSIGSAKLKCRPVVR